VVKNEDGEFELVLGNRQLISVFLIVVILLGVFFSMGYIVGRNSAPVVAESARESKPGIVHAPPPSDASSPEMFKTSEPAPASPETTPSHADSGTHPAKDVAQSAPAPAPAPTPPPKAKSSPIPPAAPPTASVSADVAPGQYWQVVATARPDAEIITETLNKKGFHTVMAPAPKEGVFRVLVGPLKDASTQAQTRTGLEAAGFKNPLARRY
jgi:hypothetical protein